MASAAAPVTTIARAARAAREAGAEPGFGVLREQAMALLRDTTRQRWTDHNLHDPGITLLEQLCFALSELVYQVDRPVADHLAGEGLNAETGGLDHAALGLHPPHEAFPCRATTAADLRRVLLDGVPELDDARLEPAGPRWPGLWRMELSLDPGCAAIDTRRHQALALARAQRGLGEDIDAQLVLVGATACELVGEIEITGPRDGAEILAEVFHHASRCIARAAPSAGAELPRQSGSPDALHDGPAVMHGMAADDAPARDSTDAGGEEWLYIADLAERVARVDGVKQVLSLQLDAVGHGLVDTLLPWRTSKPGGGHDALRLVVPGAPHDTHAVRLLVRRRNHVMQVSAGELWRRVDDLRAAERAQRVRLAQATRREQTAALPVGTPLGATRYTSVQHHLPALYGVGALGVPASAGPERQALAQQLRAYLALAEQHIANGQAQVANLGQLFRADAVPSRSYWWRALSGTEADVPGMQALWIQPDRIADDVFEPLDRSVLRKSRLLDHLLALHGERYTQSAMRPFCGHLSAAEQDTFLLRNKHAWLRHVVALGRDRAGGLDNARSWRRLDNTPGLARRAALLLGFADARARPLCRGQVFGDTPRPIELSAEQRAQCVPLGDLPEHDAPAAPVLPRTGVGALPAELMRLGASHARWHAQALGVDQYQYRLLVSDDQQRRWWPLDSVTGLAQARQRAAAWRAHLLLRNDAAEGLHVIEHLLLRPQATPQPADGAPDDFHGLRITVLLPDWTVRTQQPAFRALAEETLRINCPVHLMLSVRWLSFEQMQGFEADWLRWLRLRWWQARRPGRAGADVAVRIDAAARAVRRWLGDGAAAAAAATEEEDG